MQIFVMIYLDKKCSFAEALATPFKSPVHLQVHMTLIDRLKDLPALTKYQLATSDSLKRLQFKLFPTAQTIFRQGSQQTNFLLIEGKALLFKVNSSQSIINTDSLVQKSFIDKLAVAFAGYGKPIRIISRPFSFVGDLAPTARGHSNCSLVVFPSTLMLQLSDQQAQVQLAYQLSKRLQLSRFLTNLSIYCVQTDVAYNSLSLSVLFQKVVCKWKDCIQVENQSPQFVFIIFDGEVTVSKKNKNRQINLANAGPGQMIGLIESIQRTKSHFSYKVSSKQAQLYRIGMQEVLSLIKTSLKDFKWILSYSMRKREARINQFRRFIQLNKSNNQDQFSDNPKLIPELDMKPMNSLIRQKKALFKANFNSIQIGSLKSIHQLQKTSNSFSFPKSQFNNRVNFILTAAQSVHLSRSQLTQPQSSSMHFLTPQKIKSPLKPIQGKNRRHLKIIRAKAPK